MEMEVDPSPQRRSDRTYEAQLERTIQELKSIEKQLVDAIQQVCSLSFK
jgi:hypothetical protein